MKHITVGRTIKSIVVITFSVGLISAGLEQRNCNTGRCKHVSKIELARKTVKAVRPFFERMFVI